MATRVTHLTTCDVHEDEHDATGTQRFAVNGKQYLLDTCDDAAQAFTDTMHEWTSLARKDSGTARVKAAPSSSDAKAVREWAQANGVPVSERGRISGEVRQRYAAAMGS